MKTSEEWANDFIKELAEVDHVCPPLVEFIQRVKDDTALYAVQALNSQSVKIGLLRWVKKINSKNVQSIT